MAACAIGLLIALTLPACKQSAPAHVAPAATVKKVALGPDEPYKTLPPDMFPDMPIYPGSTILHVRRPKGAMREILFETSAQMPVLVTYFKDQLTKNNFHITSSLVMPARRTWSCDFHKNGRPCTLMVFPSDNDKSRLTIDLIYEMPAKMDPSMIEPQEVFDVVGPGEVAQKTPNLKQNTKRN